MKANRLRLTNIQKQHDLIGLSIKTIKKQKESMAHDLRMFWAKGIHTEDEYIKTYFEAYDEVIDILETVANHSGLRIGK